MGSPMSDLYGSRVAVLSCYRRGRRAGSTTRKERPHRPSSRRWVGPTVRGEPRGGNGALTFTGIRLLQANFSRLSRAQVLMFQSLVERGVGLPVLLCRGERISLRKGTLPRKRSKSSSWVGRNTNQRIEEDGEGCNWTVLHCNDAVLNGNKEGGRRKIRGPNRHHGTCTTVCVAPKKWVMQGEM